MPRKNFDAAMAEINRLDREIVAAEDAAAVERQLSRLVVAQLAADLKQLPRPILEQLVSELINHLRLRALESDGR